MIRAHSVSVDVLTVGITCWEDTGGEGKGSSLWLVTSLSHTHRLKGTESLTFQRPWFQ